VKIAHVVPSLAEEHGGPSKSVHALCSALARQGHDLDLYSTDPAAPPAGIRRDEGALRVHVFRRDWPARLCPSAGLRRALQQGTASVVHHHSLWLRTLHYANRATSRLVISPRGMMSAWAWRHRPWRKSLARWLVHPEALTSVRGWHATSVEEEAEIRSLGFTQPICVAPNGVDAPTPEEVARAREHWQAVCPEIAGHRVAVFYSRFHRKKRVLELLEVWSRHAPADWLLLLAGIPQDYQPEELERLASRLPGGKRIRAFDSLGRPPPYAVGSLFVLPSHNENFGLVIAEAMAHGLPALVTDTTPWKELDRQESGWCVPWEDFGPALARVTTENPEALRARGARARTWVLDQFSWDRSARLLGDFYAALVHDR
jgi:glycosyltransferase involved in cell wall biosynthesis